MQTNMEEESISWEELANLTHATQVERFGWCICEGGQGHISEGCPITCDICQEKPAISTGVITLQGEIAICESCHND